MSSNKNDDTITEVIPNKLYIGSANNANDVNNYNLLIELGITSIINVTKNIHYDHDNINILRIPIDDGDNMTFLKYVDEVHDFISKNSVVFIHCYRGISRSAAYVISYLMKEYNWTYNDAYNFLKEKRRCISPHINFIAVLLINYNETVMNRTKRNRRIPDRYL